MLSKYTVAVIGGSGKAGKFIVKELLNQGYQLKLLLRFPEKFELKDPRIQIVAGDARDPLAIQTLVENCHSVISAVGQPVGEPSVFSAVSRNIQQAMDFFQIKRYLLLTGLNVDTPDDQKSGYTATATEWMKINYPKTTLDKQVEWRELMESGLDWTLVRLPMIELTAERKEIVVSLTNCPGEHISATSLACFLIDQLADHTYFRQSPFIANR